MVLSRWEGQAVAVLEALACGTTVVASDIEPSIKILPPTAGRLVSVSDPKALALAIADRLGHRGRLLAVAEGEMGREYGREYVISHHNSSFVAGQLFEFNEGMPGDSTPPGTGLSRRGRDEGH
jgi:glycosyltransferase involved in cell wall biosynthesis